MSEATTIRRTLSLTEIADEMGVTRQAVSDWIHNGHPLRDGTYERLKAHRLPRTWRVYREDLETFLQVLTQDELKPQPAKRKPGRPGRPHKHGQGYPKRIEPGATRE
jgi:excisionase family DNA binding protein